jgi:hypothetical protein
MAISSFPRAHNRIADAHGIALLEVLVAVALVTITMTALLSLRLSDLRSRAATNELRTALLLLQRHLDLLPLQQTMKAGEQTGTFPAPYEHMRWTHTLKPTPFPSLWEATVRVSWATTSRPQWIETTTYLYRATAGAGP